MKRTVLLALTLALVLTFMLASLAFAHERRAVGKYEFVVGFLGEPAYAGQPNALDLRVTDTETKKPVEGLEKTLKAEVIFGGKTMPLQLRSRFGQPGAYAGDLIPTKAGTYIFHVTGTIETQKVDERFESGPGRFSNIEDTTALQFPDKLLPSSDIAAKIQAAQDSAVGAQTFGALGIGIGILGLILGGVSLVRRNK